MQRDRRAAGRRFGSEVEGLKLGVDGCPHACAHHWITDIGLQGTTARGDGVTKLEAYEIYLRGGLGEDADDRAAGAAARAGRRGRRRRRAAGRAAGSSSVRTARRSRRSRAATATRSLIALASGSRRGRDLSGGGPDGR